MNDNLFYWLLEHSNLVRLHQQSNLGGGGGIGSARNPVDSNAVDAVWDFLLRTCQAMDQAANRDVALLGSGVSDRMVRQARDMGGSSTGFLGFFREDKLLWEDAQGLPEAQRAGGAGDGNGGGGGGGGGGGRR